MARLRAFASARHVVVYDPMDDEVDPQALVDAARAQGSAVYYPRVSPAGLDFLPVPPASLAAAARRPREPHGAPPLSPDAAEVVVLVPGVAFDAKGIRLGRGGGAYDRALARHARATRIGLAGESQLLAALPSDPWDQGMDLVVTEARLLGCGGARTIPAEASS